MGKRTWMIAVLLLMLLVMSACSPTPTEAPLPTVTPTSTPAPVTTSGPTTPLTIATPEAAGLCEAVPMPAVDVRPADETDYFKGADPATAEVIIYEYSDFQCPGCAGMAMIVEYFVEENPNISLVYRHFPLDFHDKAVLTAEAVEAAGTQGKFWEMHDLLFARQAEWGISSVTMEQARQLMSDYAVELGLDEAQFNQEMDEHIYLEKIQAQALESRALQLTGTPSFIFNNVPYPSEQMGLSYNGLESFMGILGMRQWAEPPAMVVDAAGSYQVTFETSKGDILVELFPQAAPTHVNNFLFLAREGWYDGSPFFFVQSDFVALGGDPSTTGVGYPGYYCTGEEQNLFDRPGLVGMLANGQFFITLGADAAQLDGQFPLIGQVVEGLDVALALTNYTPSDPAAGTPDLLLGVVVQD